MSRLMSVAMTTDAVIERRKTVTRRKGWWEDKNGRRLLHVGDTLTLCRKVQGRKPGEPIERLVDVEVVSIRREPLCAVMGPYVTNPDGTTTWPEIVAEGFPGMSPADFMDQFFTDAQGIGRMDDVTRIEWRYIEGHPCGHYDTQRGCGGCDPGAIDLVIEDDGTKRRPNQDETSLDVTQWETR